jgi:hypothetical protein
MQKPFYRFPRRVESRLNRPAVFVYGGTILPGCITTERTADGPRPQHVESGETSEIQNPQPHSDPLRPGTGRAPEGSQRLLDIVSVFEAVGAHANKKTATRNCKPSERCPCANTNWRQ